MIMLTEINYVHEIKSDESTRILVQKEDILKVFEKHSKRNTETMVVLRTTTGTSQIIKIQESFDEIAKRLDAKYNSSAESLQSW